MNKVRIKYVAKICLLTAYTFVGVAIFHYEFRGLTFQILPLIIAYLVGADLLLKVCGIKLPAGTLLSSRITRDGILDLLRSVICFGGLIGVGLVAPHYLPDNNFGVVVLIILSLPLLIGWVYYSSRKRWRASRTELIPSSSISSRTSVTSQSDDSRAYDAELIICVDKEKVYRSYGILVFYGFLMCMILWCYVDHIPALIFAAFLVALILWSVISKILNTKPGLVLDQEGMIFNEVFGFGGRVPWVDIVDLRLVVFGNVRVLVADVYEPFFFVKKQTWLLRRLSALYQARYGSPVFVPTRALSFDPDDLLLTAKKYLNASRNA